MVRVLSRETAMMGGFFQKKKAECPVCRGAEADVYTLIDRVPYFSCHSCGSLFADPAILRKMDRGVFIRKYDARYWAKEDAAARERSFGAALARVAELFLYARRPIRRFIDIGSGPGYLLDALARYLPASDGLFWGVELFPPEARTRHRNYVVGGLADMEGPFDAGLCMEVVEHLTPTMVRGLAKDLAAKSAPNSLFLINTGMAKFVRDGNTSYLDPYIRGHVVSYSLEGLREIFGPEGFDVLPLPGKDWACLLEYRPEPREEKPVDERIWSPVEDNRRALHDPEMGNLMYIVGMDAARAYK